MSENDMWDATSYEAKSSQLLRGHTADQQQASAKKASSKKAKLHDREMTEMKAMQAQITALQNLTATTTAANNAQATAKGGKGKAKGKGKGKPNADANGKGKAKGGKAKGKAKGKDGAEPSWQPAAEKASTYVTVEQMQSWYPGQCGVDDCWSKHNGSPTAESSGQRSIFCPGCTQWQASKKKPWMYAKDHVKRTYSGKLWIAPVKAPAKANLTQVVSLPMDEEHPDYAQAHMAGSYMPDFPTIWDGGGAHDPSETYEPEEEPEEGEYTEVQAVAASAYCEVGGKRPTEGDRI